MNIFSAVVRNQTGCSRERKGGGGTLSYNECGWREIKRGESLSSRRWVHSQSQGILSYLQLMSFTNSNQ